MAIAGRVGAIHASTADAPTTFTDKATTKEATNIRYQITDETLRYWDPESAVTVKKNGTVITTGFHLEYAGGFVVFDTALKAADAVTVSGKAFTMEQCGGFFNWSLDLGSEFKDVSAFDGNGWKDHAALLKEWNGSADAYWTTDDFANAVGELRMLQLYVDSGASKVCFEGYAVITGDSIDTPVDDVVEEAISFVGTGPVYPRF